MKDITNSEQVPDRDTIEKEYDIWGMAKEMESLLPFKLQQMHGLCITLKFNPSDL